jgi:uncharacterized protein (TIGR00255 family)
MTKSMTGFGASTETFELPGAQVQFTVECRSLNSKYFDLSLRVPRLLMAWESRISSVTKDYLKRGRIELSIQRRLLRGVASSFRVNDDQAKIYFQELQRLGKNLGLDSAVGLDQLLHFTDWYEVTEASGLTETEWSLLEKTLRNTLASVQSTREKEGVSLGEVLQNHLSRLDKGLSVFTEARDRLPRELRERWRQRILEISSEASSSIDPARLEQELIFWVGRSDFSEEIDRLSHHIQSFREILGGPGEAGRRLEFLAQEMQREANTLGSKCSDARLISEVIELKSDIERIREQVLNIE